MTVHHFSVCPSVGCQSGFCPLSGLALPEQFNWQVDNKTAITASTANNMVQSMIKPGTKQEQKCQCDINWQKQDWKQNEKSDIIMPSDPTIENMEQPSDITVTWENTITAQDQAVLTEVKETLKTSYIQNNVWHTDTIEKSVTSAIQRDLTTDDSSVASKKHPRLNQNQKLGKFRKTKAWSQNTPCHMLTKE